MEFNDLNLFWLDTSLGVDLLGGSLGHIVAGKVHE